MKFKDIFKKNIRYLLSFTVGFIIWQLIFHQSVDWYKSIGIGVLIFIFNFLYDWSKIPYKWKRGNNSG